MTRFSQQGQFEEFECVSCSVLFGLPIGYADRRRADTKDFYCPNGHQMSWRESEADKLRRERDRLKQETARLDEAKREADRVAAEAVERACKAEATARKLKARAQAGVCPCCNRTFGELARHMKTKHPEFTSAEIVHLPKPRGRSRKPAATT